MNAELLVHLHTVGRHVRSGCLAVVSAWLIGCSSGEAAPAPRMDVDIWSGSVALLQAEDRRAVDPADWSVLASSSEDADARIRARAARTLGRLERTQGVGLLLGLLSDPDARVRAEAANGLAQAVWSVESARPAEAEATDGELTEAAAVFDTVRWIRDSLTARASAETDAWARAVLAMSLGRLPLESPAQAESVQEVILDLMPDSLAATPPFLAIAVASGLHGVARRWPGEAVLSRDSKQALVDILRSGRELGADTGDDDWRLAQRAALTAYGLAGPPLHGEALRAALSDPDAQVRRLAVRTLGRASEGQGSWLAAALDDPAPTVRVEALMAVGRAGPDVDCAPVLNALDDSDPLVVLTAMDALARPCPDRARQVEALTAFASVDVGAEWHVPARARLTLARLGEPGAADGVARLAAHENPFARMTAARAAAALALEPLLRSLAQDQSANVRTEATRGLFALLGHEADPVMAEQLVGSDPQLVLVSARLLEGSPTPRAWGEAALDALDRLSEGRRETHRDPRVALLARIADLATAETAEGRAGIRDRIQPYVRDYDPEVARLAAGLVSEIDGIDVAADPGAAPELPVPTARQLEELSGASVMLEMESRDTVQVRLLPGVAPMNAFRFARLARSGYFDGLTFHRVVPNFVIQGGSPGANEYWGDGPYSRDEIGPVHHWRGTVGLSTRGRDTGDAQIFVNLVDNLRLDFDYTIYGQVVEGLDALDGVLEGAVIRKAWVEP